MHYGNSSNKWAFVLFSAGELMSSECCFYRLLYMDPSAMRSSCFLKYFGNSLKEPGRKKKEWARLGGLIQEQIEEKFSCERVTTMPKHERKIEIGRGEVVVYNACLAKTSSTFPPTLFIFHEKDIWCRQWHWSIFSHSAVPLPRTSF